MSLDKKILSYLEDCPPGETYTALEIAKAVGLEKAKDVNSTLYRLREEHRLCACNDSKPRWSLQKSDIVTHGMSKAQQSKDEDNLMEALKGHRDGKGMTAKEIARQLNQNRKDVNRALYSLSGKDKVKKVHGEAWTLTDSGNDVSHSRGSVSKEDSCDRAESGLSFSGTFNKVKILGEGGYGWVYQVQHKIDDKFYALKIVKYDRKAEDEVRALVKCDHPNIVRYITAWPETFNWSTQDDDSMSQQSSLNSRIDSEDEESEFSSNADLSCQSKSSGPNLRIDSEDEESEFSSNGDMSCQSKSSGPNLRRCLFIQMEFCEEGTLFDWLQDRNSGKSQRTKQEALRVFQQVVCGVEYIHSKGFIHRDLKPENILFTAQCHVKIGDFGLVTSLTNQNVDIMKRTVGKGTKTYMSPEQMNKPDYDEKTDIFPLGLICFELLWTLTTGSERVKIWPDLRKQVFPTGFRETNSSEHKLISKMLSEDPEKRPAATEIVEFIKKFLLSESVHVNQKTV